MRSPVKTIYFYFDFISPYSYLAWAQIPHLEEEVSCRLVYKPTLFAALLNHHGQKGPAEIAAKREYTIRDTYRLCRKLGLPIEGPPAHPFLSLLPLRLCMALESEKDRQKMAGLLLKACWGEGRDITDLSVLQELVLQSGVPTQGLIERVQSQPVKQSLKDNCQEAIAKGVFGVPTFVVDKELFWGHDRIPLLIDFLKGNYFMDEARIRLALDRPRAADRKEYLNKPVSK